MSSHQRGQRTKGRLTLVILALLSVVVMAASVTIAVLLSKRQPPESTAPSSSQIVVGGFACNAAEAARLHPFQGGVLKTDPSRISLLDMNGTEQWGVDCSMLVPTCFGTGELMLVADIGGSSYYLVDREGIRKQGTVSGMLTGASVAPSPDTRFALLIEQSGNKGLVRLVSADTGREFEWDFISRKSGFVLSAAFSPAADRLDVVSMDTDGHNLQTMLKRLDTQTGAVLGQFLPEAGEVSTVVAYGVDDNPAVVGSKGITAFRPDATAAYRLQFHKVHQAVTTLQGLLVVAEKGPENPPAVFLIDADGGMQEGPTLTGIPSSLAVSGRRVYIAVGAEVWSVGLEPFKLLGMTGAGAEIVRLGANGEDGCVAVTQEGVGRIDIP